MSQRVANCRDVVPMFRLARGLSLSCCRREWLARDVVAWVVLSTLSAWSGVLPKGFPPLTVPHVHVADLGPLFAGAPGIALVPAGSASGWSGCPAQSPGLG